LYDCATAYSVPLISGKDSMKNDYYSGEKKYSIPPTLLVTVVGKVDDIKKSVSTDFKNPGDYVYVLGKTRNELGGSDYYRMFGSCGNKPPKVRPEEHIPVYKALEEAIDEGLVNSVHDVSDGGLAVCLAESAIGGGVGADLDLSVIPRDSEAEDALLFSESAGRFIVSIPQDNVKRFEFLLKDCLFAKAGRIRGDRRVILKKEDKLLVNEMVEDLRDEWQKGPEV
jgi:phosphoribosylformylglycinamidine synthase